MQQHEMSNGEVLAILEGYPSLTLGMRPPKVMVQHADKLRFEHPPGFTPYGEKLMALVREVAARARQVPPNPTETA